VGSPLGTIKPEGTLLFMKNLGYTKLYNYLIDDYIPKLSESELKVLLVVVRLTIGWFKHRDRITRTYLMKKAGLSAKSTSRAIALLEQKKLIRITDTTGKKLNSTERKYETKMYFELLIPPRVKSTHTRVKFPNSLEYNLPITKDTHKRKRTIPKQKISKKSDHERILEILIGNNDS